MSRRINEGDRAWQRCASIMSHVSMASTHPSDWFVSASPCVAETSHDDLDVIVIGGGIMGLATTELVSASSGKRVMLLESGPSVCHDAGSSGGDGRIMRYAYTEQLYVDMSKRSMQGWWSLENRGKQSRDCAAPKSFPNASPATTPGDCGGAVVDAVDSNCQRGSLLRSTGGIDSAR